MELALAEARKGRHTAHPNPVVGAVIVRDGRIISTGYHAVAGGPHAERVAIDAAAEDVRGATMYVTLEPCSHQGRTAPCSDAVIEAGLARVVAGTIDPNPQVSGRGIRALRDAGVEVAVGVLQEECWRANLDFVVSIRAGRPLITAKLAVSLDGRIATRGGDSRWISGEASRHRVHEMRRDAHAIIVGTHTLLEDDPRLTTRLPDQPDAPSPHRYVLDTSLRAPLDAAVFDTTAAPTTVVCAEDAPEQARTALRERGVTVLPVPTLDGRLEIGPVLSDMTARGYISLLVEGGGELVGSLHDRGLIDRIALFVCPRVIGGRDAVPSIGGLGVDSMTSVTKGRFSKVERIGDDVLLVADLSPHLDPGSAG